MVLMFSDSLNTINGLSSESHFSILQMTWQDTSCVCPSESWGWGVRTVHRPGEQA